MSDSLFAKFGNGLWWKPRAVPVEALVALGRRLACKQAVLFSVSSEWFMWIGCHVHPAKRSQEPDILLRTTATLAPGI
ncbi:unnamed protein product [Dicrocoelium dendriticum]|nr:unnamed protein product [Dicrocoelium dendriticum]